MGSMSTVGPLADPVPRWDRCRPSATGHGQDLTDRHGDEDARRCAERRGSRTVASGSEAARTAGGAGLIAP